MYSYFFFNVARHHRALHVLTHSFPTPLYSVPAPAYPLAWSHVYVQTSDAARIRRSLHRRQSLICDLICEMTGAVVKEVRQTVRAVGVPAGLADKLEIGRAHV